MRGDISAVLVKGLPSMRRFVYVFNDQKPAEYTFTSCVSSKKSVTQGTDCGLPARSDAINKFQAAVEGHCAYL